MHSSIFILPYIISLALAKPFCLIPGACNDPEDSGKASATRNFRLLFVVGGQTQDGGNAINDVEIVDMRSSNNHPFVPCRFKPSSYPTNIAGAVSTFIENTLLVCGSSTGQRLVDCCYAYEPKTDAWNQTHDLIMPRQRAAGAMINKNHWWITGGSGGSNGSVLLKETEVYVYPYGVAPFRSLPEPRERHSFVKIDDDRYFLTGGRGKQLQDGRKSYIFYMSNSTFVRVADAAEDRGGQFAGLVTSADGAKEVVVAGGVGLRTSEVFSLDDLTWRAGKAGLPVELYQGSSVAFGESFLLVGGFDATNGVDSSAIYGYDGASDDFVRLPQVLSRGRRYLTATLVPDDYVDC